jgi:5-(carboxyamino)imidazole ribonucleotide synthase
MEVLQALAGSVDVLTFDHEQVPNRLLETLQSSGANVAPPPAAKLLAQNKLHARKVLGDMGFPVPPFAVAETPADIERFASHVGMPLMAKAATGGYDGRGVWTVSNLDEAADALNEAGGQLLLEPKLALECELAVLVARTASGHTACYPPVETVQRDAMCREIIAPASASPALIAAAEQLAVDVADQIGATGILAVELFVVGGELKVNELALRPHNSGHYTIEGCTTSQFEQHLRAVLDLPLGSTALCAPHVVTVNVVGSGATTPLRDRLVAALAVHGAHIHLYRKDDRPGRKLGHVTVCGSQAADVRAAAQRAAALLEGAEL